MKRDINRIAISALDATTVRGATMVSNAARPITSFLERLTDIPDLTSRSEIPPPIILDTPSAKKGIQNNLLMVLI